MLLEEIIEFKVIRKIPLFFFFKIQTWKVIQNPISLGKNDLLEILAKVKDLLLQQICRD